MSASDESRLLASIDASLHDQDVYEDNVIREATHQLAPALTGVGLPPLNSLAPSYNALRPDEYNPSDLPHFHTILSKTRRKIQQTGGRDDRAHLKEQLLLTYLSSVAQVAPEELPVQRNEQAAEHKRSQAIVKKQMKKRASTTSVSLQDSDSAAVPVKRARIPMMKRKRESQQGVFDAEEDDVAEETAQRKQQLKEMREERKRQREKRQQALFLDDYTSSSSDSEEAELEFDGDNGADSVSSESGPPVNGKSDEKDGSTVEGKACEQLPSATCPICQETVSAQEESQLDAVLSQHMDQCQRRRRPLRSNASRQSTQTSATVASTTPRIEPKRRLRKHKRKKSDKVKNVKRVKPTTKTSSPAIDDMEEIMYEDRVDDWIENGLSRMKEMKERGDEVLPGAEQYPGGLHIPSWVNNRLFEYQRQGLKWMWGLHQQGAGGIVGDEMGLGKTVQVSAYLGALAASRKCRSVLIIAPATMLQHWLNELEVWAPGIRRILIHSSGEADGLSRSISLSLLQSLRKWLRRARSDRMYEAIDEEDRETMEPHSFCGTGYAVITTYENLRRNPDIYTAHEFSYIVIDEAQKIRNPDADVTLACKMIRTPHRLAMTGTPIQNDLKELWSLFDFIFPGRLGTLPAFEQEFADPIRRGGYSNASPMQVQLAYRCALMLRDLIDPYLLRRRKKEVKEVSRMPAKTEHVLFCRLSERQRSMYEAYLRSDEVFRVLRGSSQLFAAVTMLRKICNHPDLVCDPDKASLASFVKNGYVVQSELYEDDDSSDFDDKLDADESLMERSGKLEVLSKILPLWHKQGHRVLIFCQWRKMLNLIQRFTMMKGWKFGRLDGNTDVAARQRLVDSFNSDDSYFGMLCTTRTGGVGLNLTGANRIILYDPDWNPQTDAQARERAWRFGQEREVTVYRLITAGTVEEKMYQRQIFKTALSNKVLQDPRQRRLFSQRDLRDLFTLKADSGSVRSGDGVTETGAVTRGAGVVDPDNELSDEATKDNDATLKSVMKSRGLAGIFDHNFVEQDPLTKTTSVREMEDQAKRVARDAANALRQSVTSSQGSFEPTWTGSAKTESRFGPSRGSGIGAIGSGAKQSSTSEGSASLLASLRQRTAAVESDGVNGLPSNEAKQYAKLLVRIRNFVQRRRPSTDQLLKEFDDIPSSDVAIFRRLLKSVASQEKGRWHLNSKN